MTKSVPDTNTFEEAVKRKEYQHTIKFEHTALRNKYTREYIRRKSDVNIVPISGAFLIKLIDRKKQQILHKARCCVRGDYHTADAVYEPFRNYAHVPFHQSS